MRAGGLNYLVLNGFISYFMVWGQFTALQRSARYLFTESSFLMSAHPSQSFKGERDEAKFRA
jgi:hypothetical protein